MKLRYYFGILLLMLMGIGGYLFFAPDLHTPHARMILVGAIIVLVLYLLFFYVKCVKPFHIISSGMGLLKEQDFSSRLRKVGQYEADELVELFNRLMEQLKNERLRLREQNDFLDLMVEASPLGVIVMDHDGKISDINPSGRRLLGIPDLKEVRHQTPGDIRDKVRIDVSGIPLRESRTIRLSDGTIFQCSHESFIDRGFPRSFYIIESLTEEVRRAEKKAYEKVIRMIAHEVNNSTAGITSSLMTIEEELAEMEGMADLTEMMRICVERCYSMSHFITRFAEVVKIPPAELKPTDLNRLISNLSKFMETLTHGKDIDLKIIPDEALEPLQIDATLMEQVLLNIVKNAVESISDRGHITITSDSTLRQLTITDDGAGISQATAVKLFSPFFSTKPTGQGLGLLFVREVLTQHHCTYSLQTDPTDGLTRFTIRFPSSGQ